MKDVKVNFISLAREEQKNNYVRDEIKEREKKREKKRGRKNILHILHSVRKALWEVCLGGEG